MADVNYRQIFAAKARCEREILSANPSVPRESGIYVLIREENNIKYAYIGQATNLLVRLGGHLRGYQHIDISLKKRGLCSPDNPSGWQVYFKKAPKERLDEMEREYIEKYANHGYQLYNHTTGGQDGEKRVLGEANRKGYQQGVSAGYLKARREIAHLFKLHLIASAKKEPPTVNQAKALSKFQEFITIEGEDV